MAAYYNENDEFAADWLRNLIKAGLIADGEIDTRSIVDVRPDDVRGFTQCHFFAGIGGWSYALRAAGWDDNRPAWTGSCPCQPFSLAGAQRGFADERHLWPVWRDLVAVVRPPVVFGEQVASATEWLRLVRGDLEEMGYAVGALPIQAASAGADHLRDRYWFVADSDDAGSQGWRLLPERACERAIGADGLAHADSERGQVNSNPGGGTDGNRAGEVSGPSCAGHVADASGGRCSGPGEGQGQQPGGAKAFWPGDSSFNLVNAARLAKREPKHEGDPLANGGEARPVSGGPSDHLEWVLGADGKARRVKPGIRLLAHGVPNRVGLLRGFGNAIDHRPAKEFIAAYMMTREFTLTSRQHEGEL